MNIHTTEVEITEFLLFFLCSDLLREFNPGLVGGSYSRPIEDGDRNRTHCSEIMQCAQLNVAVPGATNR